MTIVIPYRDEVHKGLELKYALRSIEKYLSGWDFVVIVGDKPEWYIGDFICFENKPAQKNFNIYNKVLTAVNFPSFYISDNFIMWHDDHFLLQSLDVKDIKYWHNGRLEKELQYISNGEVRRASGRYRQAVEHTLGLAPKSLNWDIHTPIVFNKEKFIKTFSNHTDELCVKSFYCYNNAEEVAEKTFYMEDLKIPFQMPYERLKEKITNRLFFSIDSAAIGEDLIRLWEKLYPNKSKFEL